MSTDDVKRHSKGKKQSEDLTKSKPSITEPEPDRLAVITASREKKVSKASFRFSNKGSLAPGGPDKRVSTASSFRFSGKGSLKGRSLQYSEGGDDEEVVDAEDLFGQAAIKAKKHEDEDLREKKGSWAADDADDEVDKKGKDDAESAGGEDEDVDGDAESTGTGGAGGGGMMDLLGRSKAAKEELAAKELKEAEMKKRKRKRKLPTKEKHGKKDKDGVDESKEKTKSMEKEEEVWVEPEYNSEEFISKPIRTSDLVPNNILKFYESYGYDSGRRDNLQMIDDNTLIHISGNYLHFYSISDSEVFLCRRAAAGYGLGHLAIHPSKKYLAVGEKGANPVIVVYTWPSVSVYRILRRGTLKGYSFLNFSSEGDILCSQGMDPDYMLTIWDWEKEKVLLRCKAFANDVYRVTFSPTNHGDLTTCGVGHIRFWKMAETFTGLKLQGFIGRFGKTEISDIQDYVELPNGKVLSGCEWGNILVWDGGLIVCEIVGPNDKTLHDGELTSLIMMTETSEILTVGKDGYMRIWDMDTIDIADTLVDDSGKYVVEPSNEIRLAGDSRPQGCIKNMASPSDQHIWFVQDSWGRIWNVNITTAIADNEYAPSIVVYAPGGQITCAAASVEHSIMAIGTSGGHLWLMDYITKQCLVRRHYKVPITKLFWLPQKFDPRGVTFLVAFGDGCIRSYAIQPMSEDTRLEEEDMDDNFRAGQPFEIGLNQILRFSKGAINVMKFDDENEILYICGEDKTLWGVYLFYDEEEDCTVMEPLAYFKTPFAVYYMDLHPTKHYRMILAGKTGRVAECRRPEWTECVTEKSFFQGKLRGRRWWFNSSKSERRKMERREWRKTEKERRIVVLKEDIKRRAAMGVLVEEDIELARLNEEFRKAQHADDEDPIYKPEKPSEFLGVYYHINPNVGEENMARTFFVHMGDYDAGYIYECKCTRPEIGGFHAIPPTPPLEDDVAVKCHILSDDDEFLLFGMADGSIRVMPRVDIQEKIEKMRLEAEAKRKKELQDKGDDGGNDDKTEYETEATTAPPITVDNEQKRPDERKKKRSIGKGGLPPFQASIYPYDLENFFSLPMHDPNRGAVKEMAWSGDGQFLISVGEDGSIFSYRWDPDGYLESATDNLPASNLPTDTLDYEFLADEEDPYILTVEETKQKEENEKVHYQQEEFKEDVRAELRDLRELFRTIKQKNKEIPEQYRLSEEELKLPDEIYAELQTKLDEEVEEVFKIHEYESAEALVQMEKIEKNFFQPLLYHHVVVKDISHQMETHTIRQKKLSEDFHAIRDKNDEIMSQEQVRSTVDLDLRMADDDEEASPIVRVYAKDIIGEYEYKVHTYNIETIHNIRHLERRLEERYHRELAWADLLKRKIKKDFVDPEDKDRLHDAKSHRGDFQLQASETYLGDHATIAERRQKIIDLKLWIHGTTEDYNKKVLEARDEKIKILKECRRLEERIKLVQPYLPPDLRRKIPPIFEMEPCEMPESAFDITVEALEYEENTELAAAGLIEFRDQINEEFGSIKAEKQTVLDEEIKDFMAPSVRHTKSIDLEFENMTVHKYRKYLFHPKYEREETRYETYMWPKLIEQETLFKELLGVIEYFHRRVKYLHDFHIKMDIDLHLKNVGLMTLIRELDIAKEFEAQEKGILERLRVQKEEFHDARYKMDKVKKKLTKMNAEVKQLEGELVVIQKEVHGIVGEKGKWTDYLWKVFRKKVKLEVAEDGTVSEGVMKRRMSSSSESSEGSESTSQDTGSDLYKMPKMKLDINICPDHLDRGVYNKICDLRGRKAVVDQEIENAKRNADKVATDFIEIEHVYKKLEGRLTDTGQDIRVLQRRRQKRMNELKCMLIMRLDQINCVDMDDVGEAKGGIFDKLVRTFPSENKILVFPKGETDHLEVRSTELSTLTDVEKDRMKNGKQMHLRLIEELKKAEKRVEELKVKVKKEMVLKFGREVDLDKVCAAIINLELLDKEIQLDKLRKLHYHQRQKAIEEILEAKRELTAEIRENSNLKILEAMILERSRDLDYFVWKGERDAARKAQREEHRKLLHSRYVPDPNDPQ
ncbi:unnamed protein product [Orchesella dallaii]|uniref:EML-like first beta-propeller domain-containing protein n=1 Tax=Orchesella dallaii TaxID=48710 RepID=A0ABP1QMZ2_9HEXA